MSDINDGAIFQILGQNPIFMACLKNDVNTIEVLIGRGVDINQQNVYKYTPLLTAIFYNSIDAVDYLINKGVKIELSIDGLTPITFASQLGRLDIIHLLVENGANVNQPDDGAYPNYIYGYTPIIIAAQENMLGVVDYLAEKGANVNAVTVENCTALYMSCFYGNLKMVQTLISRGADKNIANNYGMTPTYIAERNGFTDVVDYLNSV